MRYMGPSHKVRKLPPIVDKIILVITIISVIATASFIIPDIIKRYQTEFQNKSNALPRR